MKFFKAFVAHRTNIIGRTNFFMSIFFFFIYLLSFDEERDQLCSFTKMRNDDDDKGKKHSKTICFQLIKILINALLLLLRRQLPLNFNQIAFLFNLILMCIAFLRRRKK